MIPLYCDPIPQQVSVFYKYGFVLHGKTYGFKNKNLFLISRSTPVFIEGNSKGWIVNGLLLTKSEARNITKEINKKVNISHLHWTVQDDLKKGINPSKEI